MKIQIPKLLLDISIHSVLTVEEAAELWRFLRSKKKLKQAASDANAFGFEEILRRAQIGYYESIK